MKEAATFHLEIDRFINAPPEKIFAAFTQESLLAAWFCPRGMTVAEASVDARVGGEYRVLMKGRDGSRHPVHGVYQAIEPPDFLAYTWRLESGPIAGVTTLIEVRLAPKDGGTALHMRHTGFPNMQVSDSHRQGWQSCFNRLSDLVDPEGGAGTVTLFWRTAQYLHLDCAPWPCGKGREIPDGADCPSDSRATRHPSLREGSRFARRRSRNLRSARHSGLC